MKVKLTQEQHSLCTESFLNEEFPTNWDQSHFDELKTFKQRIEYCENNLQRISSGSSRIAYKIDETRVLKLAKNKKGIAQNFAEIDQKDDYVASVYAEVFECDEEEGKWVIMELARKLTEARFQEITGETWKDFTRALNSYSRTSTTPNDLDRLWENEDIYPFFQYVGDFDPPIGDLLRLSTYGVVNHDGHDTIVIIDFGLTHEVYDGYYR